MCLYVLGISPVPNFFLPPNVAVVFSLACEKTLTKQAASSALFYCEQISLHWQGQPKHAPITREAQKGIIGEISVYFNLIQLKCTSIKELNSSKFKFGKIDQTLFNVIILTVLLAGF